MQGLVLRLWGLGFRVWGLGFRVWGLGFRVKGVLGFRATAPTCVCVRESVCERECVSV